MGLITRIVWSACVLRLWMMPLPSSFWIDEIGTVFVVRMGARHSSLAVAPQVPASIYFWLARGAHAFLELFPSLAQHVGATETVYRLPSLICIALASWVIGLIAARLIAPQAAWFAAFACLSLRGFDYQAADARPYALGTLLASVSILYLVRWLDRARWQDACAFVLAAALLWRVQLVYWPFYLVFACYAGERLISKSTPVRRRTAALVFAGVLVLLLPVAADALALFRQAGAHVIVPKPGRSELWRSLKMGLIALCGLGAWAIYRFSGKKPGSQITRSTWVLLASWWLVQPLSLFAFSWVTGTSVFVDRYLSIALPGAALIATAAASLHLTARQWRAAALVLGVIALAVLGQWRAPWPRHHNSDWRGAAHAIDALALGLELPIIVPSPFIEARPPALTSAYPLPGFLYAHLLVYPVNGTPVLLPYEGGSWNTALAGQKRFILYGPHGGVRAIETSLMSQSSFTGWRNHPLGDFGDVEAILFEAPL